MAVETLQAIVTYIVPFLAWAIGGYVTYQVTIQKFKDKIIEIEKRLVESEVEQEKMRVRYDERFRQMQEEVHTMALAFQRMSGDIQTINKETSHIIRLIERIEKNLN